jgi:hypothetical protein
MAIYRKDFNELAASLNELKKDLDKASADNCDNALNIAFERHVRRIAQLCKKGNPNFSFGRFYDAVNEE